MHVYANQAGIEDAYTTAARAHANEVMAALRGAKDTPLCPGVDDVESLHPVEAFVALGDACSKCAACCRSQLCIMLPAGGVPRFCCMVLHGSAVQHVMCSTV